MEFDKKEISSYLDGVPFSVGPKFCPPRTVTLPYAVSYQLPEELLSDKYDFSLESRFLAFCAAKKEADERLREEKDSTEAAAKSNGGDGNPVNPSSILWNSDSILQPKSQVPNNPSENSMPVSLDSSKKINLSDFEIDTRSPFDYMELQTINDLEELSTVFQGLCKDERPPVESNSLDEAASSVEAQSLGNVSKSISFPLVQNYEMDTSNIGTPSNACNTLVASSKCFSKNSEGYLSYSSPSVSDDSFHLQQQERSKRNSLFSDSIVSAYSALSQVPCATTYAGHSSAMAIPGSSSASLRSSKSIPDLSNLWPNTEEMVQILRSHTPPAKVNDMPHREFEKLASLKTFGNQDSGNVSRNGLSIDQQAPAGLPDPYEELSNLEKQIVDSITDMGFHQGQVSRAVKHLGTDEKKVVEHLCQIQVLEESGYDMLEAEAALHLHDYDKNEAVRYLDLINQFQDLGFEKDAIKKALVQNKNDRDKVIDALLS